MPIWAYDSKYTYSVSTHDHVMLQTQDANPSGLYIQTTSCAQQGCIATQVVG